MNILIFSAVFFPAIGGIENQTLLLINEFVKKGHKVKVITFQKQKVTLPHIDIYYSPNYHHFLKAFRWCEIIYMPNISLKGMWLLLLNPKKHWVISHNDYHFFHNIGWIARSKSFAIKFATRNIAVSKSIANHLKTPSLIIPNCYNESIFRIYSDEVRAYDFVFLGRLVSQKGCDLLIKACSRLNRPFRLSIIGIGAEQVRLEALAKDLGIAEQIIFHGLLTEENLARMLNRHKVIIIPSVKEEGFGMVALEGMACGCNVIAANAGGLSDAVNGFGKMFEMSDIDELTKLLSASLNEKPAPITEDLLAYLKLHHRQSVADNYLQAFI
ncbi:MAG: glycosyltransferase family 4 protein [Pedobacter sp.]